MTEETLNEYWKYLKIKDIACGREYAVALLADGTVAGPGNYPADMKDWKDVVFLSVSEHGTLAGVTRGGKVLLAGVAPQEESWLKSIDSSLSLPEGGPPGSIFDSIFRWKDMKSVSFGCGYLLGLKKDGSVGVVFDKYIMDTAYSDVSEAGKWKDVMAVFGSSEYAYGIRKDGTVLSTNDPPTHLSPSWSIPIFSPPAEVPRLMVGIGTNALKLGK